jgi:hypothetical protein
MWVKESVIPTTKHNSHLKRKIMNTTEPIYLSTKSDIITGKAFGVKWDSEAHDKTIERMTRGLFYFHYGQIIPLDYKMQTYWFQEPPEIGDIPLIEKSIGKGAFIYRYNKVDEMDFASIWLYEFYAGHFAGAIIL